MVSAERPIRHKLLTNYVPSNDEVQEIKRYFLYVDEHLMALRVDLHQVETNLTLLSKKYRQVVDEGGVNSVFLDGIDGLPTDITSEIFFHCLPTTHYPVISSPEPPLVLTRISKAWRRIALGTPCLWSSIHIPWPVMSDADGSPGFLSSPYPLVVQGLLKTAQVWLERSAGFPLNISLANFGPPSKELESFLRNTIIHPSARLKNLTISGTSEFLHSVASLRLETLPRLESLSVKRMDMSVDLKTTWYNTLLLRAPRLCILELVKISMDVVRLPVDWSKMTRLSLFGGRDASTGALLTVQNIATILRLSHNLVSCKFEIYPSAPSTDEPGTELSQGILLPKLGRLSVHEHNVDLKQLFDALDVPSLQHIEFNSDTTLVSPDISLAGIKSLLQHVGFQIKSFTSDLINFSESDFIDILLSCRYLSAISVRPSTAGSDTTRSVFYSVAGITRDRSIGLNDDFLRILVSRTATNVFLAPELTDLQVLQPADFSDQALSDFIEKKQTLGGSMQKLQRVEVRFSTKKGTSLESKFASFQTNGLALKLWYPVIGFSSPFDAAAGLDGR